MALGLINRSVGEQKNLFLSKDFKNINFCIKPKFQSSFIQYWYAQSWSLDRWKKELVMLRDIGITQIILQSIADTKTKYAAYFSEISGFSHGSTDMIETALTAADKLGMKVRVGLGLSDDWWVRFFCKSWLNKEASINKAIIDEVAGKFGTYASFNGWYIPHEFSQITALTKKQQLKLNIFFKSMASEIKDKLPKDIMIAPFYFGKLRWAMPLRHWSEMLQNVLKGTDIDIVALQDSIGTKYNSLKLLPKIFFYAKKAFDALDIKFYVDVETFTSTMSGHVSASQSRIEKQLSIAQTYAEGFVAFSIDHYQNKNEPGQIGFYNDYYKYYHS
jgi:hypothetical protein